MKTYVLQATQVNDVELSGLPFGEYKGIWSGYFVDVEINGATYKLRTENGIRTPSAPCIVRIQKDYATVESK